MAKGGDLNPVTNDPESLVSRKSADMSICNGVKVVRLHRFEGDSKLKAFVDVAIGDFIIKGLKVVQGQKGLFLAMPQEKAKDGKWYNAFYPVTEEARQNLQETVLGAYEE